MDRLLEATSRAEAGHFWFRGLRRLVRPWLDAAVAGRDRPRVLDGMLAAEAALLHAIDLPFGSSLLCAARKPGP